MTVDFAFLCDNADKTLSGKLVAMGIFRHIMAADFPAVHPMVTLVARFEIPSYEYHSAKQLTLLLVGPDGKELARMENLLEVPPNDEPMVIMEHIVHFQSLTFPEPGDYAFHIQIQGETRKSLPLRLVKYQPEPVR